MRGRLLGVLIVAISAAGCSPPPAQNPHPAPPTTVEQLHPPFSFVWSAEPAVDLFSRIPELIRATREAVDLTNIFGPDKTFPGYLAAIGRPRFPGDQDYEFNTTQSKIGYDEVGNSPRTQYYHIAELSISPDHGSIEAYVCGYTLAAPQNTTVLNPWLVQNVRRIELSGPASDTQPTSLVDDHPDRVDPRAQMPPTWSVFGGWHITKLTPIAPAEIPASCGDWWQSQLPYLQRPPGHNYLTRPDDNPNFQMPREPVKPQFPEWIKANRV
jgi:hypothetical protein